MSHLPLRVLSCCRCGQIGHLASACTQEVPSTETLWAEIQKKIDLASTTVPSTWKRDTHGWYLPGDAPTGDAKSFSDGPFCFNCGEFGHDEEACEMPDRAALKQQFGNCTDQSKAGVIKRQEVIQKVRRAYADSL